MSNIPPTKDDYLKAIGAITVNLTNLESEIAYSICVLNSEETGASRRITAGEPFANLLRLLVVLFKYRVSNSEQLEKFETIRIELGRVNDLRNIYIHGELQFFEDPKGIIVTKRKYSKTSPKKFGIDHNPPKYGELIKLNEDIETIKNKLSKIISDNISAIREHRKISIEKELALQSALDAAKNKFMKSYYKKIKQAKTEAKS